MSLHSSSHRLPTISATQALEDIKSNTPSHAAISTGITALDSLLDGGLRRSKVTELWGPAGAGKTGIALSAAVSALKDGGEVVWLDAATPLAGARLKTALTTIESSIPAPGSDSHLSRLLHKACPTLSHLLALVLHSPPAFPPPNTSMLVLEGMNKLVDQDYPRQAAFASIARTEQQRWQAGRRYGVLGSLVSALNKLAVLHSIVVLVTTGCATRSRQESGLGALLVPGLGGNEWDSGIGNRIVLFQDFNGRYVGVQKLNGTSVPSAAGGGFGQLVTFDMSDSGLPVDRRVTDTSNAVAAHAAQKSSSPVKPRKRHFDEVADSDGEDADEYGWADADESAMAGAEGGHDHVADDVEQLGYL